MRNCMNCRLFDPEDVVYSPYGTCEPQDEAFHCAHECDYSDEKFNSLIKFLDDAKAAEIARLWGIAGGIK